MSHTSTVPEFDSISEIILYVEDMDRMLSFYVDVLGLDVTSGAPEHGFVEFDTGACSLCLHAGGDDSGTTPPKFVFEVDDVEAARSYLQDNDVELGEIRTPVPGVQVCDCYDPEGNVFSVESSANPD